MTLELTNDTGAAPQVPAARVRPAARAGDLPLSFAQQRLWFLDQMEPGSPFYNLPVVVRMTGLLNAAALERALNEIVARHESLRTTFENVNGRAVQHVRPELSLPLPLVKLADAPTEEKEAELRRLVGEESSRPFDLVAGPLLRASLFQLGKRDYALLLTMHHIISDGWSLGVLMRELSHLYVAFVNNREPQLEPLPVQYADYSIWQREWARGEAARDQLAYWRRQLSGVPLVLELPTDRPRPPVESHAGASLRFALPEGLARELNALARREGATLFMLLFAAYAALLQRYTEQEDFLVGTPVANRNRSEIEGLIGFFVNTLVLRAAPRPSMSFLDLLSQVRETTLGAYAHQDVPFEKLVDELHPERDVSRSPLFQVFFVLQNMPMTNADLPGLKLKPEAADSGASKFDLSLYVEEGARELLCTWEYSTELFDEATVGRMADNFARLLEGVVADPLRQLHELPLHGEAERHRLLVEWNETAEEFPRELCLHELFERQAAETPDAVAVVFGQERVTYGELDRRANQMARRLRAHGVGPEVRVALLLERSDEMVVALLGLLKAGGVELPLDPDFPAERLRYMLEDSQARVLLTQRRLANVLPTQGARVVFVDDEGEDAAPPQTEEARARRAGPDNLAYVIYTSGSTGRPKGVAVPHRAIVNFMVGMLRRPGMTARDRIVAISTLSFDISLLELLLPLAVGATIEVLGREVAADGARLAERLDAGGATFMQATPATWRLLLAAGWRGRVKALCGGERLPEDLARELAARGCELWNVYGPTETTVWSFVSEVKEGERINIGRPIGNMRCYVLGPMMSLAPVGAFGELHIGGEGVGRGYLNRPALTAERFVPDPFSKEPGARMYRTGDVVRYLKDGRVEYVGRVDHQVKVRGFRIELGEIEAALREHEAVRDVCVVAREYAPGDNRLAAYLVTADGAAPNVSELRAFLRAELPEYMLPSSFVTLGELPLTPTGKVDRKRLPDVSHERPHLERSYVEPRTPTEKELARIWSHVLGVATVGTRDNFFELGGDSILTIQVVAEAAAVGLNFTPRELFQHQTVAELATAVNPDDAAAPGADEGPLTLTPFQRRFFEEAEADPRRFNQSAVLEATGDFDARLLRRAFERLRRRHDALRLRFEKGAAGWRQFVDAPTREGLTRVDLSAVPDAARRSLAAEVEATLRGRLGLSPGRPLTAVLIETGAARGALLVLVAHGPVLDDASRLILLEELERTYAQLERGAAGARVSRPDSFGQRAERLRELAEAGEVSADYWLESTAADAARLPVDFDGEDTSGSARDVTVELDEAETRELFGEALAAYRTRAEEILLTALTRAFGEWTGRAALLVDVEGRVGEELSLGLNQAKTLGPLASVYPVSLEALEASAPGAALRSVKEQLRRVPHQGLGYGLLRYMGDPETAARLRALPRAEVGFRYRGEFGGEPSDGRLLVWRSAPEARAGRSRYAFEIDACVLNGRLRVRWTYGEGAHARATVERLAGSFLNALRELIAHCRSDEAGGMTPEDFPFARLDEEKLGKLAAMLGDEEDADL